MPRDASFISGEHAASATSSGPLERVVMRCKKKSHPDHEFRKMSRALPRCVIGGAGGGVSEPNPKEDDAPQAVFSTITESGTVEKEIL